MKAFVHFLPILLFAATCFIACRNTKVLSNNDVFLSATNEDSTHGYYLLLTNDNRFSYTLVTITKENKNTVTQTYGGIYTHLIDQFSNGSYILKYNKGLTPPGFTNYIVEEISGSYIIQPFTNGNQKMFLRIRRAIDSR